MALLDLEKPAKIVDADIDKYGLIVAVDDQGRRWFLIEIPEHIIKQRFNKAQDDLRAVIEKWQVRGMD